MLRIFSACVVAMSVAGCAPMDGSLASYDADQMTESAGYSAPGDSVSGVNANLGSQAPTSSRQDDEFSPVLVRQSTVRNAAMTPPAPAESAPPVAPEAQPAEAQAVQRQVIYAASLRLVVVSVGESMKTVTTIAKDAGGYLQESDADSIIIRVPASAFEAAMERVAKLGEVVDRSVKASDVTEAMLDLNLRLDTARKSRDRLLAHLAKSDKLEDTLKLEVEIRRLTTEIEQMEGKLRFMQSQIAMSTIRVELNARTQKPMNGGDRLGVPFVWVSRLGDGLVAGSVESMPRQPRLLAAGPKFEPPAGFIRYYASKDLVEAMNADGLRIKVQRQDNYDRGNLGFWKTLSRRALVETRALAISEEREIDADTALIRGTREVGEVKHEYLLLLKRDKDNVFTYEAWGPAEAFGSQRAAIEASGATLRK